jgi:hypothetical protein
LSKFVRDVINIRAKQKHSKKHSLCMLNALREAILWAIVGTFCDWICTIRVMSIVSLSLRAQVVIPGIYDGKSLPGDPSS